MARQLLATNRCVLTGLAAWLLLAPVGCQQPTVPAAPAENTAEETWDVLYMQGVRSGYVHSWRRPIEEHGRQLVQADSETRMQVARAGQTLETRFDVRSVELPDGRLVRFSTEANLGPAPLVVRGEVRDGKLEVQQTLGGKTSQQQLPWPADALGFTGTETSLERRPMRPGEQRTLRVLLPIVNQLAEDHLVAKDYESTPLLHGSARLLRIDSTQRLPDGTEMKMTLWTDQQGRTLKTQTSAGDQEIYRTTKEEALAPSQTPKLDLIENMVVRPRRPLPHAYRQAPELSYNVRLRDGDPAKTFAAGLTQKVEPVDQHAARLTVWAAGPEHLPERKDLPEEPAPGPEYLAASSLLQLDDPAVQQLARSVTAGQPNSAERAVALEDAVYRAIKQKNFSQAFASAAEVAKSGEGDCTEHAVLLNALARATGIPSRAALGLVYVESLGGFAFHMWTEVYIGGHWLPLDATMGEGVTDATHLKLTDTSLADGATYGVFLKIAQVVGQLEIE